MSIYQQKRVYLNICLRHFFGVIFKIFEKSSNRIILIAVIYFKLFISMKQLLEFYSNFFKDLEIIL